VGFHGLKAEQSCGNTWKSTAGNGMSSCLSTHAPPPGISWRILGRGNPRSGPSNSKKSATSRASPSCTCNATSDSTAWRVHREPGMPQNSGGRPCPRHFNREGSRTVSRPHALWNALDIPRALLIVSTPAKTSLDRTKTAPRGLSKTDTGTTPHHHGKSVHPDQHPTQPRSR